MSSISGISSSAANWAQLLKAQAASSAQSTSSASSTDATNATTLTSTKPHRPWSWRSRRTLHQSARRSGLQRYEAVRPAHADRYRCEVGQRRRHRSERCHRRRAEGGRRRPRRVQERSRAQRRRRWSEGGRWPAARRCVGERRNGFRRFDGFDDCCLIHFVPRQLAERHWRRRDDVQIVVDVDVEQRIDGYVLVVRQCQRWFIAGHCRVSGWPAAAEPAAGRPAEGPAESRQWCYNPPRHEHRHRPP